MFFYPLLDREDFCIGTKGGVLSDVRLPGGNCHWFYWKDSLKWFVKTFVKMFVIGLLKVFPYLNASFYGL